MKKGIFLIYIFCMIMCVVNVNAATYYIANNPSPGDGWGNGSNSNNGLSKAEAFLTIKYAASQMKGGDTLIIADGIYTGSDNMMDINNGFRIPSGTSDNYTIIKAEHDGEVVLDGENARKPFVLKGNRTVAGSAPKSWWPNCDYIKIRGLIACRSTGHVYEISNLGYVKFINCGGYDAADENWMVFCISASEYVLVEGCYAWGNGRYKIDMGNTWYSIIRNSVVRHDRMNAGYPMGGIILYGSGNIEVQNCIVIDSDQSTYYLNYEQDQGCFGSPGTSERGDSGINRFTNCIAVNNHLRFGTSDWGNYHNDVRYTNCVGWDHNLQQSRKLNTAISDPTSFFGSTGDSRFTNCTFGEVKTYNGGSVNGHFYGYKIGNYNETSYTILYNFHNGNIFQVWEKSAYNNCYGLDSGFYIDRPGGETSISTNVVTTDPKTNGLTCLTKINSGSALKAGGIGATILKQYGKSDTLWGETGYNLLQDATNGQDDIDLWPFPNEDLIQSKMKEYSYDNNKLSGKRGFCTGNSLDGTPQTLTKYIWEYLGNPIPPEIYGGIGVGGTIQKGPSNVKAFIQQQ
ncbi:putative Pectate lyase C [Candidatus Magnetomoraceae bacterium gMMP-13]